MGSLETFYAVLEEVLGLEVVARYHWPKTVAVCRCVMYSVHTCHVDAAQPHLTLFVGHHVLSPAFAMAVQLHREGGN